MHHDLARRRPVLKIVVEMKNFAKGGGDFGNGGEKTIWQVGERMYEPLAAAMVKSEYSLLAFRQLKQEMIDLQTFRIVAEMVRFMGSGDEDMIGQKRIFPVFGGESQITLETKAELHTTWMIV